MRNLIVILLLFASCNAPKEISMNDIYGNWCLVENQVNYPELIFNRDSTATLKSRADTIYFYRYFLEGNKLVIVKGEREKVENAILKLTPDSLIFSGLLENSKRQSYFRCNPKQE
jgi:hypothetical protein